MVLSNVLHDIFLNGGTLATVIVILVAVVLVSLPLAAATTALERRRYRRWKSKQKKVHDTKIATILLVDKDGVPTSFLLPKYSEVPREVHFEADPMNPMFYRIIEPPLDEPLPTNA